MAMAWAAAATETMEVGTSILILPQRNPVILAKELSVLDEFSGERVVLGAGVGWCKEEMDAIGAEWRTRLYLLSGASAIFDGDRLQGAFRNIQSAGTHRAAGHFDTNARNYGAMQLGFPNTLNLI
jgi:alkanesulfonate monooxygenase SsuD/methylene tetrahydromethanopterin reductase-like flavin-dependent oxidoreductase (luciferase family)